MKKFREGHAIEAYKELNKHFDINQLRATFKPKDPGPTPGTILHNILHPKKGGRFKDEEDQPIKAKVVVKEEDGGADGKQAKVKNDASKNMFRDVFSLVEIIEEHQRGIERQIKRAQESKVKAEKDKDGKERASSAHPTKTVMCPLG